MRIAKPRTAARGEDVVPLINVIFLLLIFFVLAGTITSRPDFDLEPIETALQPLAEPPAGALFISASGEMSFQGQRLDASGLETAVAAYKASSANRPFEVVADRRLKAERLLDVIEALSAAGAGKVRFNTKRGEAR